MTRYRIPPSAAADFLAQARVAVESLSKRPGFVRANIGRATDDAQLWVIASQWADVGSYRRALNAFDVRMNAVPLLATAIDEPTAFELIQGLELDGSAPGDGRGALASDAQTVRVGEAGARAVPTDLDRAGWLDGSEAGS